MYNVASASDGAHTLAVRNADVPEFVSNFNMAPGHGALPKNLADLNFAVKLRFTVCVSYSRAFEHLAENNLAVSCTEKKPHIDQLGFQVSFQNASRCVDTW